MFCICVIVRQRKKEKETKMKKSVVVVEESSIIEQGATVTEVFYAFIEKVRDLTWSQILWVALLVCLVTIGNAVQLIAINFWVRHFYEGSGLFASFAVSSTFYALFFTIIFGVFYWWRQPDIRFLFTTRSIVTLIFIGFFDALFSELTIHAMRNTPEVLQALLMSMQSIWTVVFLKSLVRDERSYCNSWVFTSLLLIVVGVVVAGFPDFGSKSTITGDRFWCSLLYFISIPTVALYNVLQERYMHEMTEGHKDVEGVKGESTTVKLAMLFGDTTLQFVFMILMIPFDAVPWFGQAKTVSGAADGLVEGLKCVWVCPENLQFCLLFCCGFLCVYIGAAYLNDYSAALSSMFQQLSNPITALILLAIPKWNEAKDETPWMFSAASVILLAFGTILWAVWEELSRHREMLRQASLAAISSGSPCSERTPLFSPTVRKYCE